MLYREVSRHLGGDRPVWALESDLSDGAPVALGARAATYLATLRRALQGRPVSLFGYSAGAWMALELARRLDAAGERVEQLVIFDAPVPRSFTRGQRAQRAVKRLGWHVKELRGHPRRGLARVGDVLRDRLLSREQRRRQEEATSFPPGSHYDVVNRRNLAAIEEFARQPQAPWRGRITLVLAEETSQSAVPEDLDPRFGWRKLALGGLDLLRVPSNHLGMLEGSPALALTALLRERLDAPRRGADRGAEAPGCVQAILG
jgi:thioesterase domain-containing protein